MGVPKFFRYISERYPCLSELVKENQIPEFDNLYLDMNGIIHNCSHPDDSNVQFRITEEQIFLDIFHYIDTLFRMIQPQKLFFMAVDGVAPRAKMNQQRGRRFRSAKDAETLEEQARLKGEKLPDTARFDSNCITPGTAFMVRLQNALKYFIKQKVSTNELWKKCRIILSGHETPGEGEHKIMEYIRYLKANPKYNPNTRHCLYGLDADLVMLGLCTHDHHFSLLREEVKFGSKAKKNTSVDNTRFYLLHLGLLREYLELEFVEIKDKLEFGYDIESIVDDWIFMCYLVGNDFIPHLPSFHINSNALPMLYKAYMKVLPTLDGYINEHGILNLSRLEVFLKELGELDMSLFREQNASLAPMNNDETFGMDVDEIKGDLKELVSNTMDMFDDDSDADDYDGISDKEFYLHKRDYYIKKMGYPEMTSEVLAEQTECYIKALQWTLYYYYRGVKSWSWYYPHHYAPYISDVKNFSHLNLKFDIGKPFLPFQQLLAVLPAASKSHLPAAYHELMTSEKSKVIDYYPPNFLTDLNGKKQEWEAVVLIPFIDETRLLEAMDECEHKLTKDEVNRNVHGPMFQYDYIAEDQGPVSGSTYGLGETFHCFCKETSVWRSAIEVTEENLVMGPAKGALSDVYFPGFPTLKHIKYEGSIKHERIRVFDQPSRNESMIIKVIIKEDHEHYKLGDIAKHLVDKEVFGGWPHLSEVKVVAVCDSEWRWDKSGMEKMDTRLYDVQSKTLVNHYTSRMGIDVNTINVLVIAQPLLNRQYVYGTHGKMTLEKVWSDYYTYYPLQTIVEDINVHNPSFVQYQRVEDVFVKDAVVFMVSTMYYGSEGVVVDPTPVKTCGRIKINLTVHPKPDFTEARQIEMDSMQQYEGSYSAASSLGISSSVFSVITGSFLVVLGDKRFPLPDNTPKVNIGLQLKFPKKNEEAVGFCKKVGNQFTYSQQAIELVESYCKEWPRVFEFLSTNNSNSLCFETSIFQESGQLDKLAKWLKQQPHYNTERRTCGTRSLENDTIKNILSAVTELKSQPVKQVKLQVKPHLLYKPDLHDSRVPPDPASEFNLFDRVVMAKNSHSVPLGSYGTIIAIQSMMDPNPIRQECVRKTDMFYDVLFDQQFDDGSSIPGVVEKCIFKVSQLHLINLTYGYSKFGDNKNTSKSSEEMQLKINQGGVGTKQEPMQHWKQPYNMVAKKNSIENTTTDDAKKENEIWQMLKQNKKDEPIQVPMQPQPQQIAHVIDQSRLLMEQLKIQSKPMSEGSEVVQEKLIAAAPINSNANAEQFHKINVEDLFKVDTLNLPKPPSNWQNNTNVNIESMIKNQNLEKLVDSQMPVKPRVLPTQESTAQSSNNVYYAPPTIPAAVQKQSDIIYHPQPQQQKKFFEHNNVLSNNRNQQVAHHQNRHHLQNEHNFSNQSKYFYNQKLSAPQGPQNLSNNSMYLPGQGAFIPLQAARQNMKTKQSAQVSISVAKDNVQDKPIESDNNSTKTDANVSSDSKIDKKKFIPPKPKPSRIAARFNMSH